MCRLGIVLLYPGLCVGGRPGLHSAGARGELTHLRGAQALKCTDVSSLGPLFEGEWGFPAV